MCCGVMWCGLVSCVAASSHVVWCDVVCCGVLRSDVVCDWLVVCSGHMTCTVVCCVFMWCGWCGWCGWLNGVLVTGQVGLFGSLGYLLGV